MLNILAFACYTHKNHLKYPLNFDSKYQLSDRLPDCFQVNWEKTYRME
jgi:hypothetical protein